MIDPREEAPDPSTSAPPLTELATSLPADPIQVAAQQQDPAQAYQQHQLRFAVPHSPDPLPVEYPPVEPSAVGCPSRDAHVPAPKRLHTALVIGLIAAVIALGAVALGVWFFLGSEFTGAASSEAPTHDPSATTASIELTASWYDGALAQRLG